MLVPLFKMLSPVLFHLCLFLPVLGDRRLEAWRTARLRSLCRKSPRAISECLKDSGGAACSSWRCTAHANFSGGVLCLWEETEQPLILFVFTGVCCALKHVKSCGGVGPLPVSACEVWEPSSAPGPLPSPLPSLPDKFSRAPAFTSRTRTPSSFLRDGQMPFSQRHSPLLPQTRSWDPTWLHCLPALGGFQNPRPHTGWLLSPGHKFPPGSLLPIQASQLWI